MASARRFSVKDKIAVVGSSTKIDVICFLAKEMRVEQIEICVSSTGLSGFKCKDAGCPLLQDGKSN